MAAIFNIPTEIADQIIEEIPADALPKLRLVCKTTASWVKLRFSKLFMKEGCIFFDEIGLTILYYISNDIDFRELVQRVNVYCYCPLHLHELHPPILETSLLNTLVSPRDLDKKERVVQTGNLRTRWMQAIKRLTNCKEIHFCDIRGNFSLPYGKLPVQEPVVHPPKDCMTSNQSVQYILHTIITGMAQGNSSIERFGLRVCDTVDFSEVVRSHISSLTQISAVDFCLVREDNSVRIWHPSNVHSWIRDLKGFFQLFPNLSMLKICGTSISGPLGWFSIFCHEFHMAALESLTCEGFGCTSSEMRHFLLRHRASLRRISFKDMDLTDATVLNHWRRISETVQDMSTHDVALKLHNLRSRGVRIPNGLIPLELRRSYL